MNIVIGRFKQYVNHGNARMIAEMLGVTTGTVCDWIEGIVDIPENCLEKIAEHYHTSVDYFKGAKNVKWGINTPRRDMVIRFYLEERELYDIVYNMGSRKHRYIPDLIRKDLAEKDKKKILIEFYPDEYDLYDKIEHEKGDIRNISDYVKGLIKTDFDNQEKRKRKHKFRLFGKREA